MVAYAEISTQRPACQGTANAGIPATSTASHYYESPYECRGDTASRTHECLCRGHRHAAAEEQQLIDPERVGDADGAASDATRADLPVRLSAAGGPAESTRITRHGLDVRAVRRLQ